MSYDISLFQNTNLILSGVKKNNRWRDKCGFVVTRFGVNLCQPQTSPWWCWCTRVGEAKLKYEEIKFTNSQNNSVDIIQSKPWAYFRGLYWYCILVGHETVVLYSYCVQCVPKNVHTMLLPYGDVIMGAMAFQITGVSIVYSTVCSGADQRKHQRSASLAFVRGIHRWPFEFPPQRASNAENVSIWWRHHMWCFG